MRGVEQIPWVYDAMCSLLEATGLRKWRAWLTGGARGVTLEVGSVRRVLEDEGQLRMLEHVRSTSRFGAGYQDLIQPAWTRVAGGCHPNRDTEANVTGAGLRIDPQTRRAKGNLRRFVARKG